MNRKKLIVPLIAFLVVVFISACGSSPEQNDANDSNKDKVIAEKNNSFGGSNKDEENAPKEEESHLDETEKMTNKDMEDVIEKPEYNSFEEYVSSSTKDFNGESEMWDIYADEDDLKKHLVITSGQYLKHFNALGEIPDELQELVNDGIELSSHIDLFDHNNSDEVAKYFDQLKSIYNQLEKKTQEMK